VADGLGFFGLVPYSDSESDGGGDEAGTGRPGPAPGTPAPADAVAGLGSVRSGPAGEEAASPPAGGAPPEGRGGPSRTKPCVNFKRGKCRFGSRCRYEHGDARESHRGGGEKRGGAAAKRRRTTPSLMGKLMARSVRMEQVQLLQLFRHLVERGFAAPN